MVLTIDDAELRGYHPGNTSDDPDDADYVIPVDDFERIQIGMRAQELKDEAEIELHWQDEWGDPGRNYPRVISHGDRIEFSVDVARDSTVSEYGVGPYGTGPYGGSGELASRWTGLVRSYETTPHGASEYTMSITAEDFVFGVLGMRSHDEAFEGRRIAGPATESQRKGILNAVLDADGEEIDQQLLPTINQTADLFMNGWSLLDIVGELANRAGAIIASRGRALMFTPAGDINTQFDLDTSDDIGLWTYGSDDDHMVNEVRVRGASDYALDDELTTADGTPASYVTVSGDNRLQAQIEPDTAALDRVEIWTRSKRTGDDLTVRVQRDRNGAPIAPGDTKRDLVSPKSLSAEFLDDDGWTSFLLPGDNAFVPGNNAWILVESEGETGQEIGVTSSGDMMFRSHFPFDVGVEVPDLPSQRAYRRRDTRIEDDTIGTFSAARQTAESMLSTQSVPAKNLQIKEAVSERAHNLRPGDVITAEIPVVGADGRHAVAEVTEEFQRGELRTTLNARSMNTF